MPLKRRAAALAECRSGTLAAVNSVRHLCGVFPAAVAAHQCRVLRQRPCDLPSAPSSLQLAAVGSVMLY